MKQAVEQNPRECQRRSRLATRIAERDQVQTTLNDLSRILVVLIIALAARYWLTNQHSSHLDAATEPQPVAPSQPPAADLNDLSTAAF